MQDIRNLPLTDSVFLGEPLHRHVRPASAHSVGIPLPHLQNLVSGELRIAIAPTSGCEVQRFEIIIGACCSCHTGVVSSFAPERVRVVVCLCRSYSPHPLYLFKHVVIATCFYFSGWWVAAVQF